MIDSIHISISRQALTLKSSTLSKTYSVSTAKNGTGQQEGSMCTPLGAHIVKAKYGHQDSLDTIFVGRQALQEKYTPSLASNQPDRDYILSRILWLSGCEPGVNRLGVVDSMRRYIYIHGTPETEPMGAPMSHGCIRMRCADVIELFNHTPLYTQVTITE